MYGYCGEKFYANHSWVDKYSCGLIFPSPIPEKLKHYQKLSCKSSKKLTVTVKKKSTSILQTLQRNYSAATSGLTPVLNIVDVICVISKVRDNRQLW